MYLEFEDLFFVDSQDEAWLSGHASYVSVFFSKYIDGFEERR
jgi:hypothetical protein